MSPSRTLSRAFYERPTVEVARSLLGKVLVHGSRRGVITEVEAYLAAGDPAAHAFRGPTPRNQVLFGPAGHAYVYRIYGIHDCFNVVCEPAGSPGCVLVRGLDWVSGPGRLTRALGITRGHGGLDLTQGELRILDGPPLPSIETTPRIGITRAVDWPLRFLASTESRSVPPIRR